MGDSIPAVTSRDEYRYAVVDPFRNTRAFNTETQGRLPVGASDYMLLRNPETAAEIKAKAPWCVVTPVPQKRVNGATFTMPALPYETEWDRRHRKEHDGENGDE